MILFVGKINFFNLFQVDTFLDTLAEAYPDTVTLVNGGKSFEGRDIKYLKISSTNFEVKDQRKIVPKVNTFS